MFTCSNTKTGYFKNLIISRCKRSHKLRLCKDWEPCRVTICRTTTYYVSHVLVLPRHVCLNRFASSFWLLTAIVALNLMICRRYNKKPMIILNMFDFTSTSRREKDGLKKLGPSFMTTLHNTTRSQERATTVAKL